MACRRGFSFWTLCVKYRNYLVRKFCGNAQFLQSFHSKNLSEITIIYTVEISTSFSHFYQCVKSVRCSKFFWAFSSRVRTEYGEIWGTQSEWRENTNQKASENGHFSHSLHCSYKFLINSKSIQVFMIFLYLIVLWVAIKLGRYEQRSVWAILPSKIFKSDLIELLC